MSNNLPQPQQRINAIRLGESEWGLLNAGLSASLDLSTNQVVISVCLVAVKETNIVGQLQPLQINVREVGRLPVGDVIKLLEAHLEAATDRAKLLVVPANA